MRSIFDRLFHYVLFSRLKMSTFVSKVNRITGQMEWDFRDDDYDFKQEIARSSYADMLHDTERNKLYYEGLKIAINKKRVAGQPVHVLDIGTGTGLLSMMAARLGADTVYACEAFTPMAECARSIIAANGFKDKIKVVPKRSTELKVGKDIPRRANILVTEVFDTELIGEGAIGTFSHAYKELLEEDCIVVPSIGNMYIQLVSSELVRRWNQLDNIIVNDHKKITFPKDVMTCGGAPSLHDLQLNQLPMDTFTVLTKPLKVFRFDFTGKTPLPVEDTAMVNITSEAAGDIDAVFMWWDLEMDPDGKIILSCAPKWAHPTPSQMQWRDHWMQAIYYPYSHVTVAKGDEVKVVAKHDEYSLWFDIIRENCKESEADERPVCLCGTHISYSRSRLGMLSDPVRRKTFLDVLKKHVTNSSHVLCISDGSLLSLMAAKMGAKHVYTVENNPLCRRVIQDFIAHNNLTDSVTVLELKGEEKGLPDISDKIDIVLGEPEFQSAILPWDNIMYWYMASQTNNHLHPDVTYLPGSMTIYAVAVAYDDLWKIRADVGSCEGFDIQEFDKIIQVNSDAVDETVEPQPLWEYPCIAAGQLKPLLTVQFTKSVPDTEVTERVVSLDVERGEACNGVALWTVFDFGDGHTISTGPREPIKVGEHITWDYYSKQGVHLLYNNSKSSTISNGHKDDYRINVKVNFVPQKGDISFKFNPNWTN